MLDYNYTTLDRAAPPGLQHVDPAQGSDADVLCFVLVLVGLFFYSGE